MSIRSNTKLIPFSRKIPPCSKCGSLKVKRSFCTGDYEDCSDVLYADETRGKEHHDLNCQECGHERYMRVKP